MELQRCGLAPPSCRARSGAAAAEASTAAAMYAALRRAAPLRRRAVSALAAALLQQQSAAMGAVAPRLPAPAALAASWFHSYPSRLGFRETGPAGAAARAEFAAAEVGSFYEEDKRAASAGGAADQGLEIAKLGISSKIVDRLAKKGITKLFPIQPI
ncbi:DEAD-box ATP-dependent RNA helicase 9-like isoform X4 [Panicum virgatum]|uniref:DEAD-box ATP-dependent RNA helicase 9-like isoform X4 n=1 Tax=Panicum virgatum TaxID=38727 RepID=UPI0019D63B8F|nr:DEAD-box ATP-dependent RNA helicase 9-like isoform X4 [Panicum virgatum]XP_039823789.1 DEAD-box ATP-dependent RNA helicase 9-like isoform X4 [Panicum virgatum]